MKGKNEFTQSEINKLKELIRRLENAIGDKPKAIREEMRKIGFFISDFNTTNMTVTKFENLIETGIIKIKEG